MRCVRATDSCSVVGVSAVGKGNLFRFLSRADVQRHYLGSDALRTLFIYVDCNKLVDISEKHMYELFLRQLDAVRNERIVADASSRDASATLYDKTRATTQPEEALAALEDAVRGLCGHDRLKLVFELDEFDRLLERLDYRAFLPLRGIRDDWKRNLCYLISTRVDPILQTGEEWKLAEPFFELFTVNMFCLPPYNRVDAEFMLRRLAHSYGVELSGTARRHIVTVTGGHAGLLAVAFRVGLTACRLEDQGFFGPLLLDDPLVADECDKIRDSLDADEWAVLRLVAQQRPVAAARYAGVVRDLEAKGMIYRRPGEYDLEVFSPLFNAHVRRA